MSLPFKNKLLKILLAGVLAITPFVFVSQAHADSLQPGTISTCGELASPGTYTIAPGGLTDEVPNETCFTITSDGVTIDGNGYTARDIVGNIVADAAPDSNQNGYSFNITNLNTIGSITSVGDGVGSVGTITYSNNSLAKGAITANVVFNDTSSHEWYEGNPVLTGNVEFNGSGYNNGTIIGNVTFNDTTYNATSGQITGSTTFNGSCNGRVIDGGNVGDTTFTATSCTDFDLPASYNSITFPNAVTFTESGENIWSYDTSSWIFTNGANWIFTDTSSNTGILKGDADFRDQSTNNGTVTGRVFNNGVIVISSCTTLDSAGTYRLDNSGGVFSGSGPCLTIASSGVIVDGSGLVVSVDIDASATETDTDGFSFSVSNVTLDGRVYLNGNGSGVLGTITFNGATYNNWGGIMGNAIFNGSSSFNGQIYGDAVFNDTSFGNGGSVFGTTTFNSSNMGGGNTQNAIFPGSAYTNFNYLGWSVSGVVTFPNSVTFTLNDSEWNYDTTNWIFSGGASWVFNGTSANNRDIYGNAAFYDTSHNYDSSSVVHGDATFSGSSWNGGTVTGTATFTDGAYSNGTLNNVVLGNGTYTNLDLGALVGSYNGSLSFSTPNVEFIMTGSTIWTYDVSGWNIAGTPTWTFRDSSSFDGSTIPGNANFYGALSNSHIISGNATFHENATNNSSSIGGDATFYDSSVNTANRESGVANFHDNSINNGGVYDGNFFDSSVNNGTVSNNAIFEDLSYNSGIVNNVYFARTTYTDFSLSGTINGNISFTNSPVFTVSDGMSWTYDTTNWGVVNASWVFQGSAYNIGVIGPATFTASTFYADPMSGGSASSVIFSADSPVFTISGATWSSNSTGWSFTGSPTWLFTVDAENSGTVVGSAEFINSSINSGTVSGHATFRGSSTNTGIVTSNADVYSPVVRPLGGTVGGTISYHGYGNLFFNDQATGAAGDGNWSTLSNWWTNEASTEHSSYLPSAGDDVVILSSVNTNTGSVASVSTATFQGTAQNKISIIASSGVFFTVSSSNAAEGSVFATTTFVGDLTNNDGKVNNNILSWVGSGAPNGMWKSITSSADGMLLAAVTNNGGYVYTSTNGGSSWSNNGGSSGVREWSNISSSGNGMKLVAVADSDKNIYTSIDGGQNWSTHGVESGLDPESISSWGPVVYSSDGTKLFAADSLGYIYTSANDGGTWSAGDNIQDWTALASSADGTKLAAADSNGYVIVSVDGGATWTNNGASSGQRNWKSLASSADGTKLVAVADGDYIYNSTDGGLTWGNHNGSSGQSAWTSVASSVDGKRLVAAAYGGLIYTSSNSGFTWESGNSSTALWASVASSADGMRLFAAAYDGGISMVSSDNAGTLYRKYTANATTTRDFTTEGGRNNWIIQAYDAVVDLSSATYSRLTNIFQAFVNSIFNTNPNIDGGAAVVPQVVINSPTSGTNIKWAVSVTWDTATTCEYKLDDGDYTTTDCGSGTISISRPVSSASHVLFVKGTDSNGNLSEKSVTFSYDNTQPVYTTCGTDYLDESTRPYYYLQGNVTGNCVITANNVELRGASTTGATGYTVTGNVTGVGKNFTLKNITVTGTVSSMSSTIGAAAGSITIASSTVATVTANGYVGDASTNGGNGGTINIATSTTGTVSANGGNSPKNGGNGGTITITNSSAVASSTVVSSVGGNSTTCGYGGSGGNVTLTHTDDYVVSNNAGADHSGGCTRTGYSGSNGQTTTVPRPVIGTTNTSVVTNVSSSKPASDIYTYFVFGSPTSSPLIIPVANVKPLNLSVLPVFGGDGKNSFSFETALDLFLKAPFPKPLADSLKKAPELRKFLVSLGLEYARNLVALSKKPIPVPIPKKNTDKPAGLLMLSTGAISTPLTLVFDKTKYIVESATTTINTSITISLYPTGKGTVTATFAGNKYTFKRAGNSSLLSVTLTTPSTPGRYTFSASGAPLDLSIDVVNPPPVKDSAPPKSSGVWNFFKLW